MAKKSARKTSGAAGIKVIEVEGDPKTDDLVHQTNGNSAAPQASAINSKGKKKPARLAPENFGVGDIKKAATFVNSIGGLDKAIAILQILKVAKEVQ